MSSELFLFFPDILVRQACHLCTLQIRLLHIFLFDSIQVHSGNTAMSFPRCAAQLWTTPKFDSPPRSHSNGRGISRMGAVAVPEAGWAPGCSSLADDIE
uniref:Uncharacterized protein n=1 Tax=Knipowitschia caucasica TaxID=637954 RepID=A0AAV2KS23_KNICA